MPKSLAKVLYNPETITIFPKHFYDVTSEDILVTTPFDEDSDNVLLEFFPASIESFRDRLLREGTKALKTTRI